MDPTSDESPIPLAYASPESDGGADPTVTYDFSMAVASGLQMVPAGLVSLLTVGMLLSGGEPHRHSYDKVSPAWVEAVVTWVQWPAYLALSVMAFMGSQRFDPACRRPWYRAYLIGLVALAGLTLAAATAGRPTQRLYPDFFWRYPLFGLLMNPAVLILGVRQWRGLIAVASKRTDETEGRSGPVPAAAGRPRIAVGRHRNVHRPENRR